MFRIKLVMCLFLWANSFSALNRLNFSEGEFYMSGMNLAWVDFANDVAVTPIDENKIRKSIQDIRDAGGNSMRWWLFTNASKSPTFSVNGVVDGIGSHTINNVKAVLDIAEENGVKISLCLLSFDLMQRSQIGSWNHMSIENNKKMLQTEEGLQALIDKAIIPLVKGVGEHSAILSWEVFNEPEGMTEEFGWTSDKVKMIDVQKSVNWISAAIKKEVPNVLISNGSHSFYANSDVPTCSSCKNYYSDSELISAGGKATGTLDFYQVHYYPQHFSNDRNPFAHPASYWRVDKPIVIGEFPAGDWMNPASGTKYKSEMKNIDAVKYAFENGYAGTMAWDVTGFTDEIQKDYVQNLETSKTSLEYLYENKKTDVLIKEVQRTDKSGNGVMRVNYQNVTSSGATIEGSLNMDWSQGTHLEFDARSLSGGDVELFIVLKLTEDWTWTELSSCVVKESESWTHCTIELTGDASDYKIVKSILVRNFSDAYTGGIEFDNVKVGSQVVEDFNEEFALWGVAGNMEGGESIAEIKTVFTDEVTGIYKEWNEMSAAYRNSIISVELYSAGGQLLKTWKGNEFELSNINKIGRYLVKLNSDAGARILPLLIQ